MCLPLLVQLLVLPLLQLSPLRLWLQPLARVVAIACWPMCAAIAASWSALSWYVATLLASASAATCCLLSSHATRLSRCVWSSNFVEGNVLCPVKCSARSLACFSLSGSRLSRRCSISGVNGIGSLPLLLRALECVLDAPDNEPKLRRSLSLSLIPLPCSAIGSYLIVSGIPVRVTGATGALLAMLALVPMVFHAVLDGNGFANDRRVDACYPCVAGARLPLSS